MSKIVEFFLGESPAKRDRRFIEEYGRNFLDGFEAGLKGEKSDMPFDELMERMHRIYSSSLFYQPDEDVETDA